MAKTEKQEATILPIQVRGTVSPYPIVVTVIWIIEITFVYSYQPANIRNPDTENMEILTCFFVWAT
jgi:hypothetical protein